MCNRVHVAKLCRNGTFLPSGKTRKEEEEGDGRRQMEIEGMGKRERKKLNLLATFDRDARVEGGEASSRNGMKFPVAGQLLHARASISSLATLRVPILGSV